MQTTPSSTYVKEIDTHIRWTIPPQMEAYGSQITLITTDEKERQAEIKPSLKQQTFRRLAPKERKTAARLKVNKRHQQTDV